MTALKELPQPLGGPEAGPETAAWKEDRSDQGPGGAKFAPRTQRNLAPAEGASSRLSRVPGPGDPGFRAREERNQVPGEAPAGKKRPLEKR